jgi:hypothetical protein
MPVVHRIRSVHQVQHILHQGLRLAPSVPDVSPFQGFASSDIRTQGGAALALGWHVRAPSGLKR